MRTPGHDDAERVTPPLPDHRSDDAGAHPAVAHPMADEVRLRRRVTFDSDAERYARARPDYPRELFDAFASYARLGPDARVLEIASGTGKATRGLAQRGWSVTGVELGQQMAGLARRDLAGLPNVDITVADFETWPLPPEPFDAAFCATAFHWLDPTLRLTKTAAALRPGGTFAVVWTQHVAGGSPGFDRAAQELYVKYGQSGTQQTLPLPEAEIEPSTQEFEASPLFRDVESHTFGVDLAYSADTFADLVSTYSATMIMTPDARDGLLSSLRQLIEGAFGGHVTSRYLFELDLARRS